ncbi:MAG: cysteine desulfurase [Bacilli bacterium]|nr:cysteine desulfurase [Bacilli bacterium]
MTYLDFASSTPPRSEVLDRFAELNRESFANPSSTHALGREAERKLEQERKTLLDLFGVGASHRAVFLSSATEGNNLALKGVALQYSNRGKKILVSSTEHPSVIEPLDYLANTYGFEVIRIPVDSLGRVLPETLQGLMDKDVILVSVMGVNNETGAVNDLAALSKIVHAYPKAFFHSDLTQAIGKTDVPYKDLDLFTFSAHKIHGLKGVGALVLRSSIRLVPSFHGGGQEYGFRSSTVSLPLAGSLVKAVALSLKEQKKSIAHVSALRDVLLEGLQEKGMVLNSYPEGCPFVVNFSLPLHKASVIVEGLSQRGIYVSSLSACSSKTDQVSYVLLAMGKSKEEAGNSIRVSLDGSTSLEEVESFLNNLSALLLEVRPR